MPLRMAALCAAAALFVALPAAVQPYYGSSALAQTTAATTNATLGVSAEVVTVGQQVTVTVANAPGAAGDQIGLYADGASDANPLRQSAVSPGAGTKTWTAAMPTSAGTYHFRYVSGGSSIARSPNVLVAAGRILTVGGSSPQYTTPSAAASAARSGDVVLIRPGTYAGFTANVGGVTYMAERRHATVIAGTNTVISGSGEGVTLKGLVITGGSAPGTTGSYSGLVNARTGWVIEDCIVKNSDGGYEGVRLANGVTVANNIRIERTVFQDNGGNATWGYAEDRNPLNFANVVYRDVLMRRNNRAHITTSNNGGTKLLFTKDLLVDGLVSYDNFGIGFWLDFGSRDYVVRNSTLFANHGDSTWSNAGMKSEANPGPGVVINNVFYSNARQGLLIAESQNLLVEGNIFIGNPYAWEFRACCSSDGRSPPSNISIRNNRASGTMPTGPGSNIVITGSTSPLPFAGPLLTISQSTSGAPQVTTAPEQNTIDMAIAGASAGATVTIPVYGRRAIEAAGPYWKTQIYDLSGRYVPLLMTSAEARDEVASTIPPYASVQARTLTVRLSMRSASGYGVEAQIGQGAAVQPTATLTASPATISAGSSSMLTWSSTNAQSCTGSGVGFDTGGTASGQDAVSPPTTTTYQVDCNGAVTSATVTVIQPTADATPPTVAITQPADGTTVPRGLATVVKAVANDDGSGVGMVTLRIEGELVAVFSGGGEHSHSWSPKGRAGRTVRIEAVATDRAGNGNSHAIQVTVSR